MIFNKKTPHPAGFPDNPIELVYLARLDAHKLAVLRAFFLELDVTVSFRKKRMVPADADVDTRMKTRAALANDDVTRDHLLAAEDLHA